MGITLVTTEGIEEEDCVCGAHEGHEIVEVFREFVWGVGGGEGFLRVNRKRVDMGIFWTISQFSVSRSTSGWLYLKARTNESTL